MIDYRLYLVTDDPSRYAGSWLDNVVASVEGGVTCVQYRDTESAPGERLARVRKLQDALKKFGTPVIVNNDAELAASVKAEGVHVGQSDMPPAQVRAIVGPDCEIGLSITDISQLTDAGIPAENRRSRFEGSRRPSRGRPPLPYVSCLGIGPVFDARKTKADASEAMGVSGLGEALKFGGLEGDNRSGRQLPTANYQLSTVAIGGITLENAAEVLATGVDGLAVVSAFSKSPDPFSTAQAFRKLFK